MTGCVVIKIKEYTHIMKIECASVTEGLICFFTRISPAQIKIEAYVSLQICFKCYKYEDHSTNSCPERDIAWCSECGGRDHKYDQCKATTKKCLNCGGPHRTMAMACTKKKSLIVSKKDTIIQQKITKENSTYANVAKAAAQTAIRIHKKRSYKQQ